MLAGGFDALSQRSNDTWVFGARVRFDFDGNIIQQSRSPITVTEGTACYSDPATGDLLLYTDGTAIYGADDNAINNGMDMPSGISGTQNSLIVPQPGSDSLFWFFFANDRTASVAHEKGFWYSVVDITAFGGAPSVIQKNVLLLPSVAEKVAGTRDCETGDYWIVTHNNSEPVFTAYRLTADGLTDTVVSNAGPTFNGPEGFKQGYLKFSASGTKLAMASSQFGRIELFDFNPSTGEITFRTILGEPERAYGVAFSPSEDYVYCTAYRVWQYRTAPPYTETELGILPGARGSGDMSSIQRTPAGRMLIPDIDTMRVIARPDSDGFACGFDEGTFPVLVGIATMGLPNFMDHMFYTDGELGCSNIEVVLPPDTSVCVGDVVSNESPLSVEVYDYQWQFEGAMPASSSSRIPEPVVYNDVGVFRIQLIVTDGVKADTGERFVTVNPVPEVSISQSSNACYGDPIQLVATGGVEYLWDADATLSDFDIADPVVTPETSRMYYVWVTNSYLCTRRDSIWVELQAPGVRAELRPEVNAAEAGELGQFLVINKTSRDIESVTISFDIDKRHFAQPILRTGEDLVVSSIDADRQRVSVTTIAGRDTVAEFQMLTLLAEPEREVMIDLKAIHGCDTLILSPRIIELFVQNCGSASRGVVFDHEPLEIRWAKRSERALELHIEGTSGITANLRICNLIGQVVFQDVITLPYSGGVDALPHVSPLVIQVYSGTESAVVQR